MTAMKRSNFQLCSSALCPVVNQPIPITSALTALSVGISAIVGSLSVEDLNSVTMEIDVLLLQSSSPLSSPLVFYESTTATSDCLVLWDALDVGQLGRILQKQLHQ